MGLDIEADVNCMKWKGNKVVWCGIYVCALRWFLSFVRIARWGFGSYWDGLDRMDWVFDTSLRMASLVVYNSIYMVLCRFSTQFVLRLTSTVMHLFAQEPNVFSSLLKAPPRSPVLIRRQQKENDQLHGNGNSAQRLTLRALPVSTEVKQSPLIQEAKDVKAVEVCARLDVDLSTYPRQSQLAIEVEVMDVLCAVDGVLSAGPPVEVDTHTADCVVPDFETDLCWEAHEG
jgi:hypothetical protein